MAEREITPARLPIGVEVTPEILVPRLGEYLVEKGHLLPKDLEHALDFQRQRAALGKPLLLGQALRELHLVKSTVLDQAITEQILQLQLALKQSNQELEARIRERTLELEQAIEKLGELSQLKANFIANVSHELRTPLTHLKGYLEILADGEIGPLTGTQSEAVAVMRRAEARLEALIEDLIQFSLVTQGQLTLEIIPADISHILRDAVDQARHNARSKGITLDLQVPEGLPLVLCDGEKIAWVLSHFLDNAFKFTPRQGLVKVEAYHDDKFVKISVIDTGIGMQPARLEEIFEPFHQLDGSMTRRYGGTGLGLALSRRILEAHNAVVHVDSEIGQGSRFEFSLAVAEGNGVNKSNYV